MAATMLARPEIPKLSNRRISAGSILRRSGEIVAAALVAEQQIERIARRIRHRDHDVGIHDVVDEWNVLVADALDVVLAVAVAEHGRAFGASTATILVLCSFFRRSPAAIVPAEPVAETKAARR